MRLELDLRGVRCPLNWAKAKVRLEDLDPGTTLTLLVDDARATEDIPRAAQAQGYGVISVVGNRGYWSITLEA